MLHIYVSYPGTEYDFAHRVVEDLQARGYPIFIDAVSEVGSMAWATETRAAIRRSGAVVMIMTPDEGRRTGIRHEGILANRGDKPLFVLKRTAGSLPRYMSDANIIDCSTGYEAALQQLIAALPEPAALLRADPPGRPRKPPPAPPRQPEDARQRRRLVVILVALVLLSALAALALGYAPI